ncbi:glutathione S-transferase family protein [Alteromonas facilis]|uniref:glutathione S-transferase family protein n=1 Tax=Alteromonas facilis TaxID=2048004 RepID=UPI000C287827|nr:glutathione S-transferase [Alteromonas facilis]
MLVLHHLNNSRSQRILWLLEELEIDYTLKTYQRDAKTNLAPAELKLVHPLGKSPVITDGEATIAESGAIIEYLVTHYGNGEVLSALTPQQKQEQLFWNHFAEGSFMPPLVTKMVLDKGREKASPFFVRFIVDKFVSAVMDAYFGPNITANIAFVERHLSDKTWFLGDVLSAADFQMSFPLEAIIAKQGKQALPNIAAFVERVQARDAYQRALAKGGRYDYA